MAKLTKPQIEVLREIESGRRQINTNYRPTALLHQRGLISITFGRFGGELADLTDAGRPALSSGLSADTAQRESEHG